VPRSLYVISYDIVQDRRRARMARLLEGLGYRVQYSVFECAMNRGNLSDFVQKGGPLLDLSTDSLRIYPLCASCAPRASCLGQNRHIWEEPIMV